MGKRKPKDFYKTEMVWDRQYLGGIAYILGFIACITLASYIFLRAFVPGINMATIEKVLTGTGSTIFQGCHLKEQKYRLVKRNIVREEVWEKVVQ